MAVRRRHGRSVGGWPFGPMWLNALRFLDQRVVTQPRALAGRRHFPGPIDCSADAGRGVCLLLRAWVRGRFRAAVAPSPSQVCCTGASACTHACALPPRWHGAIARLRSQAGADRIHTLCRGNLGHARCHYKQSLAVQQRSARTEPRFGDFGIGALITLFAWAAVRAVLARALSTLRDWCACAHVIVVAGVTVENVLGEYSKWLFKTAGTDSPRGPGTLASNEVCLNHLFTHYTHADSSVQGFGCVG